ncbi:MAG: hypothetical protein GF401_08770 [Chitinivibrionales bacterium]|nr:hypothetical protein [Chitinivibrionales bacterium]
MRNIIKPFMDIHKNELPFALAMFFYFFLVISTFWILKPLKKSLFITFYDRIGGFNFLTFQMWGSQAELLAKILNMVVAAGAVTVFSLLSRWFRRQKMTFTFALFFMACFVIFSYTIRTPSHISVWTFYLVGDLFSTIMVATFFAFLNDSVSPKRAKRIYGPVGLGGVAGGVFGATILRSWLEVIDRSQWMWICFTMSGIIIILAFFAGQWLKKLPENGDEHEDQMPPASSTKSNPALAGAKLVFKSRYLLSIIAIVAFYEIASTIMDFQFTATIEYYLSGKEIGRQFSTIYMITNWVSMLVQIFLTGFIMTHYNITVALLVLPIAMVSGSTAFLLFPLLWVGSFLNTADNGFAYSINQSAKEALYVSVTVEEKYKAKAFIDMFVQRFAKVLAIGVSLIITLIFTDFSTLRWLSFITIAIAIFWSRAALNVGKKYPERKTDHFGKAFKNIWHPPHPHHRS